MRLFSVAFALLLGVMSSGCATVLHGTSQDVTVQSSPSGAEVYDRGVFVGQTPARISLKRERTHLLTLRLDGYDDAEVYIGRRIDALPLAGNLVFTTAAPLGFIIDVSNGAAYALDPDQVYVELQPQDPGAEPISPEAREALAESRIGPRRQNGPRFGVTYLAPGVVERVNEVLDDGDGEDTIQTPLITQFGWQFETQTFQTDSGLTGVVEFVPLIGGLERGRFFPTFTLIAGARTVSGLEFGVGPNISLTSLGSAERGSNDTGIAAGLTLVGGKSVDIGGANVPVNAAIVLGESGARISLLIGLTTTSGRY